MQRSGGTLSLSGEGGGGGGGALHDALTLQVIREDFLKCDFRRNFFIFSFSYMLKCTVYSQRICNITFMGVLII